MGPGLNWNLLYMLNSNFFTPRSILHYVSVRESHFLLEWGVEKEILVELDIHQWGSVMRGASSRQLFGDCLRWFKTSEAAAGSSRQGLLVLATWDSQPTAKWCTLWTKWSMTPVATRCQMTSLMVVLSVTLDIGCQVQMGARVICLCSHTWQYSLGRANTSIKCK